MLRYLSKRLLQLPLVLVVVSITIFAVTRATPGDPVQIMLGTQTSPPNQVVVGLSLFLTFFVMAPVADRVYSEAYQPLAENRISFQQALDRAAVPLRGFMLKQTREADIFMMADLAKRPRPTTEADVPMTQLAAAFMVSELRAAFQIGFVVFLPFLLIDLLVSSILMALGMMMMPPVTIAMPLKILMFVLVDGWGLLLRALIGSFH